MITDHIPSATRYQPLTLSLAVLLMAWLCAGQDIEPRRWNHTPIGANFGGSAYACTIGEARGRVWCRTGHWPLSHLTFSERP